MRKSLRLFLVVTTFALIGSIVFAYAPVMKSLPNVYIGDKEDWTGPGQTVDTNMFRYSDAFDLDDYVSDGDTTPTTLVWSFYEFGNGYLEINGITELADPSQAATADILNKDIRHPSDPTFQPGDMIDFWDEKDSPRASPPWGTPSSPLDEYITMFVSDGTYVDSDQMLVQAVDNGWDGISPTTIWTEVYREDFETDTGNWSYFSFASSAPDASYATATSSYDGSKVGVQTDDTTSRFGFWNMGTDRVTPSANKLYKLTWTLSTNQADQLKVPTTRMRINEENNAYTFTMAIQSSNAASNPFMPTSTNRDYNQYLLPRTTDAFYANFDVYDFDNTGPGADSGNVYCDELVIYEADTSDVSGWASVTVPVLSTWGSLTSIPPYHSVTSGQVGGLQLTSSVSEGFAYGFWNSSYVTMAADKLYRALFTISSSDTSPPNGMVRVSSEDLQVAYRFSYLLSDAPDSDGEVYPIYLESHDMVSGQEGMLFVLEIADFEDNQGGTITLSSVTVENTDIPD